VRFSRYRGESAPQGAQSGIETKPKQSLSFVALNIFRRIALLNFWVGATLLLAPASAFSASPAVTLDRADVRVQAVMVIQKEVTVDWMRQPEVIGTAVGLDESGSPALIVYIDRDAPRANEVAQSMPSALRGTKVRVRLTDKFRAHRSPGVGGSTNGHTTLLIPPIELGTSGGWRKDTANGYCCGGTLGALVSIGGTQYILSNYHVFEGDAVPGNGVVATTGDPIIEPGLPDVDCNFHLTLTVATLAKRSSLPGHNVDCSIGQVIPNLVRTDGSILEIGTLSSTPLAPALNQAVKKSGRTTGLTHSYINGLNATITVEYDHECHSATHFTKTFTGQILFANDDNSFEDSGDSGSLVVEDVGTRPRPIGLLFAGNGTSAAANPIGEVLSFLGATIVGSSEVPTQFANISTRLSVGTGDNEMIAGFIITGTEAKRVIVRAMGPSLPLAGALADPVLELRNSAGDLISSNDNWRSDQEAEIMGTGIPPGNDLESAIVATLPANNSAYTASVRGFNNETGIGVVEAYDLNSAANSKLANISTRGLVQTADNVLIGGLIVQGQISLRVIVRAIGPSLPVEGALQDPTLELRDSNGSLIAANDNWRSDQQDEIIATGLPPSNDLESAIVRDLAPAAYTAIVRGVNSTTGVALVEAYGLN